MIRPHLTKHEKKTLEKLKARQNGGIEIWHFCKRKEPWADKPNPCDKAPHVDIFLYMMIIPLPSH